MSLEIRRSSKKQIEVVLNEEVLIQVDEILFSRVPFASWKSTTPEEFFIKFSEIEQKVAWNWALKKLTAQSLHSQTLKKKMKERCITETTIDTILVKLQGYGFLDDAAFTTRFINSLLERGKSLLEIYAKAKAVSLPLAEVRAALEAEEAQNLRIPALRRLIERKYPILLQRVPAAAKRKALAALARKGFSFASVESALKG